MPGTRRELTVHRYGKPGARPRAYLQAGLHADEHPGMLVLGHLLAMLDEGSDPIVGEIVIVPVANPAGLAQLVNGQLAGRFALAGGGNFNRNFPDLGETVARAVQDRLTDGAEANAELIRQAALHAVGELPRDSELNALRAALLGLSVDADYVLDLHCDLEALVHLYAAGAHAETAAALGAEIGAEVVLLEEEPGGQPFDEANAGLWLKLRGILSDDRVPLSCFAATVELRGRGDVADALAAADAANLYRFLQRRGVIGGEPGPEPEPRCVPTPLSGTDVLRAPSAGLVLYRRALGDRVEAGETVAEILDPTADAPLSVRQPVVSRSSGVLLSRARRRVLAAGETVAKVAGAEPLPHRRGGSLLEA